MFCASAAQAGKKIRDGRGGVGRAEIEQKKATSDLRA